MAAKVHGAGKTAKRAFSLALSLLLGIELIPRQALAYIPGGEEEKPAEIVTAQGESVAVDESWEEAYPYGIFLFDVGEANITEGGETASLRLCRLGGTQGRATAYIYYAPAVMQLDEDRASYETAAGWGDVRIEVEDPLPIADYQPLGKSAEPERGEASILDAPYTGDDGEEGDRILTLDTAAESWQWYVLSGGTWQIVEDATAGEFVVSGEMMEEYDFRCVYSVEGTPFCTDSLKGERYEKAAEEMLPARPGDLDLRPETTFSPLEMDPEDPYAGYVFQVTFADGEWVKEIKVTAPEDEIAESIKAGTFTIVDHDGADIYSGAATLTLTVADNDAPEPYTIGFTAERFEADRAEGVAKVTLRREGGTQTLVTVDYATADGTAVAGRDYQRLSGTAAFFAGVDEAVIEVPLIQTGAEAAGDAEEPPVFRVVLGEVKGDGEGLCTLVRTETEVALTGQSAEPANLVSLLYDSETLDASGAVGEAETIAAPVENHVVTGEQVVIPEEDVLRGEIEEAVPEGGAGLMTYNYGRIRFPAASSGSYWNDTATVAGQAHNDLTGWSGGEASGSGWEYKSKSPGSATLDIRFMSQMYSRFSGRFAFSALLASSWNLFIDGMEYVYGWARIIGSGGSSYASVSSSPRITKNGLEKEIEYTTSGSLNASWDVDAGVTGLGLQLSRYDEDDAKSEVYSRITSGTLTRRVMEGSLNLRIHTANDGESGGGNTPTAPEGAAKLTAASGVYESMKPKISVVPNAGGVSGGRLYVGSQILVSLQDVQSYQPVSLEKLNSAVYLTRSDGTIVNGPQIVKSGQDYYITLVWDGMTEADLREDFTINVAMSRVQKVSLNLSPSVPRLENKDGSLSREIDTTRVDDAWTLFWKSSFSTMFSENVITFGCSEALPDAPHFAARIREVSFQESQFSMTGRGILLPQELGTFENLQYINFNRSPGDRIVLRGRTYKGNERIWLTVEDLAFDLEFLYYNAAYLDAANTMTTSVSRVEVYLDGDGDGKISGSYNESTGYFNLTPGTADEYVRLLDADTGYDEIAFQPVDLGNGKFGEYFLKIYYTMTPRSLMVPTEGGQAQVLPALTTTVTDPGVYSTLTEEQQSYRYILSGLSASGTRTSDNHPMYGAEANRIQYVDVPLGGDRSPVEAQGDESTGYTFRWTPEFRGNLLAPFTDPEPITIDNSLAGENIPLAATRYTSAQGVQTDSAGKANLNGYLGSFVGNTTVALCAMEQAYTADQLRGNPAAIAALQPESSELIHRSATPNADYLTRMEGQAMGQAGVDSKGSGVPYQELAPDYGMDLPIQKMGNILGNATIATNKDEVMMSVSVPFMAATKVNDGKMKTSKGFNTIVGPKKKQWDEMAGLVQSMREHNLGAMKDALKSNGNKHMDSGALKSRKFMITLSATLVLRWKYDNVTNAFYFKELGGGVVGAMAFKYTYRFAPCPVVYVYVAASLSVSITTGGLVTRTENERATPYIDTDAPRVLQAKKTFLINTKYQNLKLRFHGKIYLEVLDSKDAAAPSEGTYSGFLKSDGKDQTLKLSQKDGPEFSGEKWIRIVALEDSTIDYLNVIESVSTEMVWSGVKISPSLAVEVGGGIGVDFMKAEVCVKVSASAGFVFGMYDEKTHNREGIAVQSAAFAASVALRAVLFTFNYEIDAVGVAAKYAAGKGWSYTWTHFGTESSLQSAGGEPGSLRLPEDVTRTERVYSPEGGGAALQAYQPDDQTVPFQLSGYNSSVSAFRLSDGLALGYDYQVIPVNGENYVLYTYGRAGGSAVDKPMLVLSRLVSTGGAGNVGLVNPLDDPPRDESDRWSDPPYLVVDAGDDGGDLEFRGWADGNTIRAAWVSYSEATDLRGDEDAQEVLRQVSRKTVVKTASFDTTGKDGFTSPVTVSGLPGERVSLPAPVDAGVTAFVRAEHMSGDERDESVAAYTAALKACGYDPNGTDEALRQIGRQRLTTQVSLWDAAGKRSSLCVTVEQSGLQTSTELRLPEGQTVDNIEFTQSGGTYYAAYTTREVRFTDDAGTPVPDAAGAKNILTIRRLFLNGFTISGGDKAVTWANDGKGVLLRTLYDYEDNTSLQDGLYTGGALTPCEEPYFANLQFLRSALGDTLTGTEETFSLMSAADAEDFLLFEMNGCTYVIRQAELSNILRNHRGTVIPFFTADTAQRGTAEEGAVSATGRTEVTIGADGEGGLAAVYVGTVPNTTNTALYMSKFDSKTGTWGQGVILAMNHMDVYEDAIAEGWEPEEAEQAYLGRRAGYSKGGMDQFTFSAPRIALGVKGEDGGGASDLDSRGSETTLLVLTQGQMNYLRYVASGGETYLTPNASGTGKYPAGTGLYAISYGCGHQTVGEAALRFLNYDFTAGSLLSATLSFKNTGDVSIRGSSDRDQAITVSLSADGAGVPGTRLASWTITENIVPGQRVELGGDFTLPVTLPEGARFNLTVSEGSYYQSAGGTPYAATLPGVLTVGKMPELGFESSAIALAGADSGTVTLGEQGEAVVDVDFMAGNRGNDDASGVYVQFTYDTGKTDESGAPVYAALDISRNTLTVGAEEPLVSLQARNTATGVLSLGALRTGYGRRVRGTITLSPDKYFVGTGNALGLRVELFSEADRDVTEDGQGVISAVHGEYNGNDNGILAHVESAVSFLLAEKLLLPKGTLVRLPIHYRSATGSRVPDIQAAEYPDKEDTDGKSTTRFQRMDQNLDLLYFEPGSYSQGAGSGTVVVRAAKEGQGYIRLMDRSTNSYQDVPFQVTPENMGMDVSPDNGRFTFYNAGYPSTVFDPSADPASQSWTYSGSVDAWGADDSAPYRSTLMKGERSASFVFETQAEAIRVYLDGQALVISDFSGFRSMQINGIGGSDSVEGSSAFVYFGANPENKTHTVRLSMMYNTAVFDRIVEYYSGDSTGEETVPDQAPRLYWSRNFPEKGTLSPGTSVSLALNVTSAIPLASVSISANPSSVTDSYFRELIPRTETWWTASGSIQRNGQLTIDTVDRNGNHRISQVTVDWWKEGVSLHAADDGDVNKQWMSAELVQDPDPAFLVRIDPSAPYEDVFVVTGREDTLQDIAMSESGGELLPYLHFMSRGSTLRIPARQDGLNMVLAYCYAPDALIDDPEYTYEIQSPDGSAETYDARQEYFYNLEMFQVEGAKESGVCVITFAPNGGAGEMAHQFLFGEDALTPCAFTRDGYRFTGWNTRADGSGTAYRDGQRVTIEDDLTLYAQWSPVSEDTPEASGRPDDRDESGEAIRISGPAAGETAVSVTSGGSKAKAAVRVVGNTALIQETAEGTPAGSDTVFDLSGTEAELVRIPAGTFRALSDAVSAIDSGGSVTVKTAGWSLSLDRAAVLAAAARGGEVLLGVKPADERVQSALNGVGEVLTFSAGGQAVSPWKGGSVRVSVPLSAESGREGGDYRVYALTGSGEARPLAGMFRDGKLTFRMGENVPFALVYEPAANPFRDVESGRYYTDSVLWAVRGGVTAGTTAETFSPDAACTRAQMVTFLWRAFGCPEPDGEENPFRDVPEGAYYRKAVLWAAQNGITRGTSADTFSPNETVSRAQCVVFLWRGAGCPPASGGNAFTDVPAWCAEAVAWAAERGITLGTSDNTFSPDNPCRRGQIVTFLYRYFQSEA